MATTVTVSGSFDNLRSGDIRFLEEASRLGDVVVWLWPDALVTRQRGSPPRFSTEERRYLLESLRYVSEVQVAPDLWDPDLLPDAAAGVWAMRTAEVNDRRAAFCRERGIALRRIAPEELQGFPEVPPPPGATARKRVIVTGCYDWLHSGHVRFFEEASAHGDLYVTVGSDANVRGLKGDGHPLFPEAERRYVVQSIRFVTLALVATGDGWLDAEPEIQRLKPHIYAVNEDGDRPVKREYCEQHGLEYLVLKRVPREGLPRRSSTDLRGF